MTEIKLYKKTSYGICMDTEILRYWCKTLLWMPEVPVFVFVFARISSVTLCGELPSSRTSLQIINAGSQAICLGNRCMNMCPVQVFHKSTFTVPCTVYLTSLNTSIPIESCGACASVKMRMNKKLFSIPLCCASIHFSFLFYRPDT